METNSPDTFQTLLLTSFQENLRRFNSRLRGGGRQLDLSVKVDRDERTHQVRLWTKSEIGYLTIPYPRQDQSGNWLLGNRNDRVLCPMMLVLNGQARHISYEQMVLYLLFGNLEELFPSRGPGNCVDRILRAFLLGQEGGRLGATGRLATDQCQRFLNLELLHTFPLTGTPMQDWAMNRRLMIFDPSFDVLRPEAKLAYQKRKNELLYPWGSIGLSDGAAATKNYLLQADLKQYTAFGRHHNPIRNLYSTTGMKGDEKPLVISHSAANLETKGIARGGWNWMTAFLDLPFNFEDQILVDRRHASKQISYRRSFTIYGMPLVKEGDTIRKGRVLGLNADQSETRFELDCEHARVLTVEESVVPFDGLDEPVVIVTLEVTYCLREGVKITNQHGNKGIIVLADLGTVQDPVRGEIPLDVLVSARTVQKRKNFGQVLEAFTTLLHGPEKRHVISDDLVVEEEQVRQALARAGYPEDGTCQVRTPWGEFSTICGWVHWGVTKTPEEQLWQGRDTWTTNQRGLRQRGNKISTVELKSLTTLLGPQSAVVEEILSYQQGVTEVHELLRSLDGLRGNYQEKMAVVEPERFCYLPAGLGTFHDLTQLYGTMADETMYPKGCYLQLPFTLRTVLPDDPTEEIVEGLADQSAYDQVPNCRVFETDRLYVPASDLRTPWLHPTGKYGLSDIATSLNQILEGLDRLRMGEVKENQVVVLVYRYLHYLSRCLSTKTGKLSNYLMAVRYPWSSKATASLGEALEPNWIEIHVDMARDLRVLPGDYVLVERFPCLGFMSTRVQRVRVTDDPQCKYVIRVSGNSLVSMNLDFDGDVIYVMSFHTEAAREELKKAFHDPHPQVAEVIRKLNSRKQPLTQAVSLSDLGLRSFEPLEPREHAALNETSLAVKLYTGPVIALCYNLMRIAEGAFGYRDREAHINVEVFLDKVGNSVFSQKHGTKSLREECVEAVCLAKPEALVALGFPERESRRLCAAIRERAARLGVRTDTELAAHYQRHVEEGRSNILSSIVRHFHPTYFATRSNLHPIRLLDHLEKEPRDLAAHLVQRGLRR